MKKGKVLVTGSGGFNGRRALELLKERGYDVRATDLPSGERTAGTEFYERLGVEFVPSDLTDRGSLRPALKDAAYVLHTASLFDYSASLEANRKVNVEGMRNLCGEAAKAGVRKMVLWSTIGVYGRQKTPTVTEESEPNPGNAYEISKLEQEEVALEHSRKGRFAVTVVRPAPVYGPGNRYGFVNILKLALLPPSLPVLEKLNSRMPSVHVEDAANAALFLLAAKDSKTDGRIFNLVDDSNLPVADFLHFVAGLFGKQTFSIGAPIHKPTLLKLAHASADVSSAVAKALGRKRPLLEAATVDYLEYDHIYSNEALKRLGYRFLYPDCRVGLIEMIDWMKAEKKMRAAAG